jgi:hypothetical protein
MVLFLSIAAAWVFAWSAWNAAPLRAQQMVTIDLGYAAENLVPPEALLGEWHAVINRGGNPQPIVLSIMNVTPGKTAGKMIFASPRRCVIDLEYGGPDRGRHIFYIIRFTNCFEYARTDFIALAQVAGDDIAALAADGAEVKRRRAAEILSKYTLGQPERENAPEPENAKDAVPIGEDSAAAPSRGLARGLARGLGRIVYAINLAGEVEESAILKRR